MLVAAGRLPELDRRQHRREHLLRADRVHLLADDLLDLAVHAPAERQERPEPGADLADEAAADEQLVRDRLRVGGRVAQGRQEELGGAVDHREQASPSGIERGFGHRERGRLRHLQPLRALHAAVDPAVDLVEELVDQDVRRDLLQHAAVRVDEADVAAAGDPEVGVARLPGPVHGAAHHGDLEGLRVAR